MTPAAVRHVHGGRDGRRAGTYAARATHSDASPGAGAGGPGKKKGRPQPHVATGPELRQKKPNREERYPMFKILALIWALVAGRRRHDDDDQVDLVPAACDDCGYPMSYCCCVPDDERCTGGAVKTVDQAGRVGVIERCADRAVASGGSAGGGLPPTSWAYCEDHYAEHLELERDAYDLSDYYDYVEATR